jgi:ABC-type nitrate/sulfonate/bicarbonate transport system ATPase subunit
MTTYTKEEVLLQARYLNLFYGDKYILRNVNFSIRDIVRPGLQQGQVVSLVGRSGIGKTQLFRVLAGLQKTSSGAVMISPEGGDARGVRPGDMGVIFQNYYQFGWRTVQQSLRLAARQNRALRELNGQVTVREPDSPAGPADPGTTSGMRQRLSGWWEPSGKVEEAIRYYTAQFDLEDVLHRYPHQLSGGQQQRVSIIQQLLKGSDFLLLDEPFSGLDVCVLDKVVDLLLRVSLSGERKTLIIVSHDIDTAVAISDTVFILGKETNQPGSTIVKEIDLIERGLAWEKDVREKSEFRETIREIKSCL